jgi:hypothetical protein
MQNLKIYFCSYLKIKIKPVLFAVRTNVSYEPSKDHTPPVPLDMVVAFDAKDYLHIKHVYKIFSSMILT